MANSPAEQERIFREWLRNQFDGNGIRKHTDNSIISYCYSLRTACHKLNPPIAGNLFAVSEKDEYVNIHRQIIQHPGFNQLNQESGNGALEIALRLYQHFLNQHEEAVSSASLGATMFLNGAASRAAYTDNRGLENSYREITMRPLQRIYYGAPGTGKSHTVSMFLESVYPNRVERDRHCKRLIFHPTYTYDDFVGCIKPLMSLDKPLDYIYCPGPFTTLLKEAFLHPTEKYYLVIEEINRGNSPAIFGDLFQLLDRTEEGKSAYSITNIDVTQFFSRDPGLKKLFTEGKIWLPANFNIISTMNTADENIFVLDSAFKRRFELVYVKIDFTNMPEVWRREYDIFKGPIPLMEMFRGTQAEPIVTQMAEEGELKRNWPTFARIVNYIIDRENLRITALDRPDISKIPENKKLGPFFISKEGLQESSTFVNKVVFYLKQDVFDYSKHYMLSSFEEIHSKYVDNKGDLFELLV